MTTQSYLLTYRMSIVLDINPLTPTVAIWVRI